MIRGFLDYIALQKRYSKRTVTLYGEALHEFYAFIYPEKDTVDNLTKEEILEVLASNNLRGFIAHGLENGLTARTVNLKLSAISSFCNWLVKQGELPSNPARRVFRPKEARRLPEFYTTQSLDNYFALKKSDFEGEETMEHLRARMLIMVLYATGMRRSEICNLKVGDFDASREVFRIVGKGDKPREVPVPSLICEYILLYLKRLGKEFSSDNDSFFFVTDKGAQMYPAMVNNIVKAELSKAEGFTGRKSPHLLRHSLATHLLNNGADLNSIKEILGHSSLAATQVYTHNSFEQLKKTYLTAHPRAKIGGKNGN
ncbi:MAG: tyrosine-type recombinase/integrase [Bacteroidales bacterium]|nr:tyrosine-type recombinase/integrase [Bacteroidales bacterium]